MISELLIRFKNIRGDDKKGFPVISGLKYALNILASVSLVTLP